MDIDLGDLLLRVEARLKHRRPPPRIGWHVGVATRLAAPGTATTPTDDSVHRTRTRKADLTMDLLDDQQVPLSLTWTDDANNPTSAPAGATATFSVDDTNIINLTDNGDGTAVAAATGTLGTATVSVNAALPDGTTATGDLALVVVTSTANRVTVTAGPPTHV